MRLKLLLCFGLIAGGIACNAQVTVGLDNWYNHETNAKTGKAFHYLWNDTAYSGYSRWGSVFEKKGAVLKTMGQPGKIELNGIDAYVIVDPDTTSENPSPNYISTNDIALITSWVTQGGVLIIMANDGPNCEFTHLNNLSRCFGILFNHATKHPVEGRKFDMGAFVNLPAHPIFKDVHKIYLKEIAALTLSGKAKPVLSESGFVYMAEVKYGKGFVFAVGDPWIYNEYMDHDRLPADFDNRKAADNLSAYILAHIPRKN